MADIGKLARFAILRRLRALRKRKATLETVIRRLEYYQRRQIRPPGAKQ